MYLLLARATSRIVWPAVAAITSPSMRTFTFSVTADPPYRSALRMSQRRQRDVSFSGRHGGEAQRDLGVAEHPLGGGHLAGHVAAVLAGRLGWLHPYSNSGKRPMKRLWPISLLVDVAGRLLAVAHGVRDVRGAGDQVAAGVEALTAGLERVAVDLDRAAAGLCTLRPEALQKSVSTVSPTARMTVSHSMRITSSVSTGRRRPEVSNSPSFVRTASSARTWPLLVAHDPVRGGEVDDLRALVLGGLDLLRDRRHVPALAAVDDRHVRAQPARRARGVDGGVAAADHDHPLPDRDLLVARHGLQERERRDHAGELGAGQVDPGLLPGADGEEDGVVLVGHVVERDLLADVRR